MYKQKHADFLLLQPQSIIVCFIGKCLKKWWYSLALVGSGIKFEARKPHNDYNAYHFCSIIFSAGKIEVQQKNIIALLLPGLKKHVYNASSIKCLCSKEVM